MAFTATKIPYSQTGYFSATVIDYLNEAPLLKPFYEHEVSVTGLADAINIRKKFSTHRNLIADAFTGQYKLVDCPKLITANIEALRKETTFTITTAHQPNIFTGPLYFIYKILHAIKLAAYCAEQFPQYHFVPVYYMGSEDADLDELGHIYMNGEKLNWETEQTGAVGRMKIDKNLIGLIKTIAGEIGVLPHGSDIISIIRDCYTEGSSIQDATFKLVHHLFGSYGLLVLIPDQANLKRAAIPVFKEDLLQNNSANTVVKTGENLIETGYKAQAYSRDINFFYLIDNKRERIEKEESLWKVVNSEIFFSKEELLAEIEIHPERFSPNVILRGLFQEIILPNIAFIGGGGELAYWLQLKDLFHHYKIPYPLLVLRNSFLLINKKNNQIKNKLVIDDANLFQPLQTIQKVWIHKNSTKNLDVSKTISELDAVYKILGSQASDIDPTLQPHVEALKTASLKKVKLLHNKMLRAEKRNHAVAMQQTEKLKLQLFPNNNLQERIDNFLPWYALYGGNFIEKLYNSTTALEQTFSILAEE
ncbi:MAG: bacillithiol biosynthesis cysteine-adding enzyme BshC [Niabella sp.]